MLTLKRHSYILVSTLLMLQLSACVKYEYHQTRSNELQSVVNDVDVNQNEASLLDVGIILLDAGVDELDEESIAYASVRRSEAVWFSERLKTSFENSNAWGIVRTLPNEGTVFDLTIQGKILESNGEDVRLQIDAFDASGRQWLSKEYFERVSQYAYHPEIELNRDPFQNLFNNIANDLFAFRQSLDQTQLLMIREIAKVRFAQSFAPEVFADYLQVSETDTYQLRRLPAQSDPMTQRINRIRARNDLFLDVIQDYYRIFNNNMTAPYDEWRKLSYKEVVYSRQLTKQAKAEKIAGVAIILSGVLAATSGNSTQTRVAGHVGIASGAEIFHRSFQTGIDASQHGETLREFGESLEIELEPSVVDLQDRSITLSGTVEDQFKEWRAILKNMFEAEQSLSPLQQLESTESSSLIGDDQDVAVILNGNKDSEYRNEQKNDGAL